MNETFEAESSSLPVHVIACSERFKGINARLKRLEMALYILLAVLIANGDGPLTKALIGAFK